MPVDLLAELDIQIAHAEEVLVRLRNARAALANHRAMAFELPTVAGPVVDGLPLTQAIRQVLQWNFDRGREVMTVGDVYEALKNHNVTKANGKPLWENEKFAWKAFAITCTAPNNLKKYWLAEKAMLGNRKHLLKTDTIQLKPVKKSTK